MRRLGPLDARIPRWNAATLRPRPCPFCAGEGTARFERPDGLVVRECGCGAWFVSPAPTPADLDAFYRTYDQAHRRGPAVSADLLQAMVRTCDPRLDFRFQEIASMVDLDGARCLDVGSGWGAFLVGFHRLGARPVGLELDEAVIAATRQALPFAEVRQGRIADVTDDASWRVITMIDYVEHPLEPLADLRQAVRLLEPGGLLVVWTPNASFAGQEAEPVPFRVDLEHLQYLTFRACAPLAGALGVELVHLEGAGFPDLAGIDVAPGTSPAAPSPLKRVKSALGSVPGVRRLHRAWRALASDGPGPDPFRTGRYHLFAIFRKPT